jgi:hypothetical protein
MSMRHTLFAPCPLDNVTATTLHLLLYIAAIFVLLHLAALAFTDIHRCDYRAQSPL